MTDQVSVTFSSQLGAKGGGYRRSNGNAFAKGDTVSSFTMSENRMSTNVMKFFHQSRDGANQTQ